MLTRRPIGVLVAAVLGLVVGLVLWVLLFAQPVEVAPLRYPTFEAAKPAAMEAGGRYRWPGTSVRIAQVETGKVEVERRWLGMRESLVRVQETQAGWDVASPVAGPARAAQAVLGAVIPGVFAGALALLALSRTRKGQARSVQNTGSGTQG